MNYLECSIHSVSYNTKDDICPLCKYESMSKLEKLIRNTYVKIRRQMQRLQSYQR
jgi:hypothetical protein